MAYKHLLIDLDGTLLHAREFRVRLNFLKHALMLLKSEKGFWRAARAIAAVRRVVQAAPDDATTNEDRAVKVFERFFQLDVTHARNLLHQTLTTVFPRLEKYFYPVPGAKEFILWAKTQYPLTLATNPVWPEEVIGLRVKWAGLTLQDFKSITHVSRMHATKPWNEYYTELLKQEGLKAEECLLVGNDPINDLAATRVGIAVFLLSDSHQVKEIHLRKGFPQRAPAWSGDFGTLKFLLSQFGEPQGAASSSTPIHYTHAAPR